MAEFNPNAYGPIIAELLAEDRLNPLDPGTPNEPMRERLEEMKAVDLFEGRTLADPGMADACLSALWLYHDFLDISHTISQGIKTPTGSYWHMIMHRREPDFSNAKHWVARTGRHPVFEDVCAAAKETAAGQDEPAAEFLKTQSEWDAAAFVDLCESSLRGQASCEDLCRKIQRREWELLFDYSYHKAIGD